MSSAAAKSFPTRFGFLLVPDFTLISMSSAVETLRMANRICGTQVYDWKTISEARPHRRSSRAAAGSLPPPTR